MHGIFKQNKACKVPDKHLNAGFSCPSCRILLKLVSTIPYNNPQERFSSFREPLSDIVYSYHFSATSEL